APARSSPAQDAQPALADRGGDPGPGREGDGARCLGRRLPRYALVLRNDFFETGPPVGGTRWMVSRTIARQSIWKGLPSPQGTRAPWMMGRRNPTRRRSSKKPSPELNPTCLIASPRIPAVLRTPRIP